MTDDDFDRASKLLVSLGYGERAFDREDARKVADAFAAVRADALERAARVADSHVAGPELACVALTSPTIAGREAGAMAARFIAADIRALKPKGPTDGG